MDNQMWITHPHHEPPAPRNDWLTFYNSRELPLKPQKGILNVKKAFSLRAPVKRASVISSALGIYRLYVNGQRVSNDELKPGWTDYCHRVLSYEYDITDLLQARNTLLAEVASGWWSGYVSYGTYGYKNLAFAAEITIEYTDGTQEVIKTDDSWQAMVGGPTRYADIWDGQYYDATLPHPAKDPGAYVWDPAVPFTGFSGRIEPNTAEPVRVRRHLSRIPESARLYEGTVDNGSDFGAVKVVQKICGKGCEAMSIQKGQCLVLDFGQEIVGWPSITVSGKTGTELEVFFGEMLNDSGLESRGNDGPEGSLYIKNYRAALARYVVKLAGQDPEIHTPSLTFYGFRYIELRSTEDVEILAVEGLVLGSNLKETGTFSCDNEEVNRLYSNIVWGMRGNYLSVPTDCPQRNERLGWTGDTQIFCGAASYLADVRAFLGNWLADCRNSQQDLDGAYADIVPRSAVLPEGGSAAWADAGILVPFQLYKMYGDRSLIQEHYSSMEAYMHYLERNGLSGPNPTFGDWLNYDHTDNAYVSVCYYAYDLSCMIFFSELLEKSSRTEHYRSLRDQVVAHWQKTYVQDGLLTVNTQTAYLLPLAFDMVPQALLEPFKTQLRALIESNDCTLSTGFVGTGILCQTLEKLGMSDLCYGLLLQTRDPSWLYSVRQGATTIWERWNSYTLERGFGDVNMNSFNHYSYGAVAEWLYSGMCGILPDVHHPGFSRFFLQPTPDIWQRRITQAKAAYHCLHGIIESSWKLADDGCAYDFVIPEGTCAQVRLLSGKTLTVNHLPMSCKMENGRFCFRLEPGRYHIFVQR